MADYRVDFLDLPEFDRALLKRAITSCSFTNSENSKGLEFSLFVHFDALPNAQDYLSEILQKILSTSKRLALEIENPDSERKIYIEDAILTGTKRTTDYDISDSSIIVLDFKCSSWHFLQNSSGITAEEALKRLQTAFRYRGVVKNQEELNSIPDARVGDLYVTGDDNNQWVCIDSYRFEKLTR